MIAARGERHYSTAAPRHCAACGRGLTERTRCAPDPEDRLLLALVAPVNLCGWRALCVGCAPVVIARTRRAGGAS